MWRCRCYCACDVEFLRNRMSIRISSIQYSSFPFETTAEQAAKSITPDKRITVKANLAIWDKVSQFKQVEIELNTSLY